MHDAESGVRSLARHLFKRLREHELLFYSTQEGITKLSSSPYGDLLASYYISFKVISMCPAFIITLLKALLQTFQRLLRVKRGASTSDIVGGVKLPKINTLLKSLSPASSTLFS